MRTLVAALLAAVAGCSGQSQGTAGPIRCDRATRRGTYMMTFVRQSGDCPEPAPQLVSLDPASSSDGCLVRSTAWSADDCRNDISLFCELSASDPSAARGHTSVSSDIVGYTIQTGDDGSRIDGVLTDRMSSTDGQSCVGTFAVSYVRQ